MSEHSLRPALSPVVAGCWRLAEWGWSAPERLRWIEQCLERGVTTFDHADIYGGYRVEALFGEALALAPHLRARLQLVSKCGIRLVDAARPAHRVKSYDTSAAHIVASVDSSLRALRTDHLDLLLIHRPDPLMRPGEIADAVARLKAAGKILDFGVSNFTMSQFAMLNQWVPLATNQIELSPLHRAPLHDGTLDQMLALDLRPMIWSPLAGGRLFSGQEPDALRVRAVLEAVAQRHGVAPATVAYAWLLRHPSGPRPIVGSRRLEALDEALAAQALTLDAETWHEIWSAGAGVEVP
ncbi:aldo/keto reductase [Sphaerotilus uruguayifluvii]|uniref:Oxidoreductase n=1 Tax=Sphaerotilus uruguayifluvii TaxID=2735897 RepID=A0ABX2G366_9BURK|nr:aldo/keto reductase [Leptothrix sp. C29]NRT56747.1 putative oxidoreductase [Leptothrix sp. C29]